VDATQWRNYPARRKGRGSILEVEDPNNVEDELAPKLNGAAGFCADPNAPVPAPNAGVEDPKPRDCTTEHDGLDIQKARCTAAPCMLKNNESRVRTNVGGVAAGVCAPNENAIDVTQSHFRWTQTSPRRRLQVDIGVFNQR
jgi:hypothetical protein